MVGTNIRINNRLAANLPTALVPISVSPQKPQRIQSGRHLWPNRLLGQWLKGASWCLQRNSDDYQAMGGECLPGAYGRSEWVASVFAAVEIVTPDAKNCGRTGTTGVLHLS